MRLSRAHRNATQRSASRRKARQGKARQRNPTQRNVSHRAATADRDVPNTSRISWASASGVHGVCRTATSAAGKM